MGLVTISFLVLMSLAGGLVALIADKLGRTLGKKRLTLMGMRPRHTATAITVVSGMVIPLVTMGVAAAISQSTREMLFETDRIKTERDKAQQDKQALENTKRQLQDDIVSLQAEENKKVQEANNKLVSIRKQVAELTNAVFNYRSQITGLQKSLTAKQTAFADAQVKFKHAQQQLSDLEKNLAAINTKYNGAVASYQEAQRQRDEANEQVREASDENDRLTSANASLKADNDRRAADLARIQSQLDQIRPQLEKAKLQLDDENTQLAGVQKELVRNQLIMYNNVTLPLLTHVIFDIGDELGRVRIPAGTKENAARGMLANLMKLSVQAARAAGAKPTANGDEATLFPPPDENGHQASVSEHESEIVAAVTNQDQDYVLIAVCELNAYQGGSVPVDIQHVPDPIIYKANDKIAETTINGNASEEEVVQRLSDFLQKDVRPKALKDGMIPIGGSEASLGELSLADLLKLAHSINDMSRPVRVTAIADGDTRAADPLRLKFRVR